MKDAVKMNAKKIVSAFLAIILAGTSIMNVSAAALSFSDVPSDAWYEDAVADCLEWGLFSGVSETTFFPNGSMTRAMFCVVLNRLSGDDASEAPDAGFTDVSSGAWYAEAVSWAKQNGYVNGTSSSTFSPETPITREQIATILCSYLTKSGFVAENAKEVIPFLDADNIGNYAKASVDYVRSIGLMEGDTAGNFNPKKELTRAEAAAVFSRLLKLLKYDDVGEAGFTATENILLETSDALPKDIFTDEVIWGQIKITDPAWNLDDYALPVDWAYPYTFASSDESIVKVDNCGNLYAPAMLTTGEPSKTATISVTNTDKNTVQYTKVTVAPQTTYKVDDAFIEEVCIAALDCMNEMRAEKGLPPFEYMPGDVQPLLNARAKELETSLSGTRPTGESFSSLPKEFGYYDCDWLREREASAELYLNKYGEPVSFASASVIGRIEAESSVGASAPGIFSDFYNCFGVGYYCGKEKTYIVLLWGVDEERFFEDYLKGEGSK